MTTAELIQKTQIIYTKKGGNNTIKTTPDILTQRGTNNNTRTTKPNPKQKKIGKFTEHEQKKNQDPTKRIQLIPKKTQEHNKHETTNETKN